MFLPPWLLSRSERLGAGFCSCNLSSVHAHAPRVCVCLGDGKKSVLQLSNGPEQTNSTEIRGVQAGAMHCTGRRSLLVLLR